MQPIKIPAPEEIVRTLERLIGLEKPEEAPLPIFDAPLEIRKTIQKKITEDLHPDLYENIEYDMLARRYEDVPELVDEMLFGYLVKIEYLGDEVLMYDGEYREEKVWSTYFKRIHDPQKMLETLIALMQTESGQPLDPNDIQVIEVLPNIPMFLWKPYLEGEIDIEDVRKGIEELPEV